MYSKEIQTVLCLVDSASVHPIKGRGSMRTNIVKRLQVQSRSCRYVPTPHALPQIAVPLKTGLVTPCGRLRYGSQMQVKRPKTRKKEIQKHIKGNI
jgi:hypothetical protein